MDGSIYKDLLGLCFKWGAFPPEGVDCWTLAVTLYKRLGINIEIDALEYSESNVPDDFASLAGSNWQRVNFPSKPLDVIVFKQQSKKEPEHIAVFLGNNKIIEATKSHGVIVNKFWRNRPIYAVFRWQS